MGLYVHIPFCLQKCDYCDFFSLPCASVSEEYIDSLINEAAFWAKAFHRQCWQTLYIGGGTPSLLSPHQLARLIPGIIDPLGKGATVAGEATIEMNPETLTKEKLIAAREAGINRLSLGVQALNDQALSAINRHSRLESTLAGLETVRQYWKGQLSLDAIAGLPGQDRDEFLHGLEKIISYNPDHISLYSLMVEEGTPLYDRIYGSGKNLLQWDSDEADAQWLLGRDMLEAEGFHQYEVSNFARDGHVAFHNLRYWRQQDYIGIGSGATGTVYGLEEFGGKGFRWMNAQDVEAYTGFFNKLDVSSLDRKDCLDMIRKGMPPCETELLERDVLEEEFFMMGLRTLEGVNSADYERKFGRPLEERLRPVDLERHMESGRVRRVDNQDGSFNLCMSREGILFLNSFLTEIL